MALRKHDLPILESDLTENGLIHPSDHFEQTAPTGVCAICFFKDAIDVLRAEGRLTLFQTLRSEAGEHPIWLLEEHGVSIGLFHPMLGGAFAAGLLEEAIALGFRTFLSVGGAGVLQKDIVVGRAIVPDAALRQEGVSYQYLLPSRTAFPDESLLQSLKNTLDEQNIPYMQGLTWTTDAFYRETKAMIAYRKEEGCLCVEMECASFFAVAKYRGVRFASLLYGGDDVSSEVWDGRGWHSRADIRRALLDTAFTTLSKEVFR